MKLRSCSGRNKKVFCDMLFKNNVQLWCAGTFLKFLSFPSELGNFQLFQQARCELIAKYINYNLLEHEWLRTGIRTIDEKIRTMEFGKMLLVLQKEKSVMTKFQQCYLLKIQQFNMRHQPGGKKISKEKVSFYILLLHLHCYFQFLSC